MTIQLDNPTSLSRAEVPATRSTDDVLILTDSRSAALEDSYQQPSEIVSDDAGTFEGDGTEVNIFAPQVGLKNKLSAYRARRRLYRRFRHNQRQFDIVMDSLAHDPAAQRELQASWTLGH